jgi:hypothetical protein
MRDVQQYLPVKPWLSIYHLVAVLRQSYQTTTSLLAKKDSCAHTHLCNIASGERTKIHTNVLLISNTLITRARSMDIWNTLHDLAIDATLR